MTIDEVKNYFRKIKLKLYKKKKVRKDSTPFVRNYGIGYKIHIDDEENPVEIGDFVTIVPARAAYFAKLLLERNIKRKVYIEVNYIDEIEEGVDYVEFLKAKNQNNSDTINIID